MATLFEAPYSISFKQRPYVKCTLVSYLASTPMQILLGETLMRTIFNIVIKTDIPAHDEARRQALVELFTRVSRTLLTQTTMVSKGVSPNIKVTSYDNDNGIVDHPLFDTNTERTEDTLESS